jgi:ribosome-associated protein
MTRTYSNSDPDTVRRFAIEAARLVADLKCSEVVLLDVRGHSQVSDYVIVANGTSQRQMRSVADDVAELGDTMEMAAYRSSRDEGTTWIVVDFVEVVVHLFEPEQRLYYDLELMWSQAKRVDWRRGAVESDAATTKSAGSDDEQTKPAAVSKKAPAKKAPANAAKAPAKKSTAKKSTTKKSTAKKSTTKKTSTRRARSDD